MDLAKIIAGATLRQGQAQEAPSDDFYAPQYWDYCDSNAGARVMVQNLNDALRSVGADHDLYFFKQTRQTSTGNTYWIMYRRLRRAPVAA